MSVLQVGEETFKILDNIPQEYTDLTNAISALFYACGSKKLCGACFAGKLQDYAARDFKYPRKSNGCCGHCSNLSAVGCVQKPIGCASWLCTYTAALIPEKLLRLLGNDSGHCCTETRALLQKQIKRYTGVDMSSFFRLEGFKYGTGWDRKHIQNLTPKQRRGLRLVTKRVKVAVRWAEKNFKPNWPLMQRITRAEPGALA